jgi:hypothetical protein
LVPALIVIFLAIHLFMVVIHKHTHYSGPGRTDENVVGYPLMPVYVASNIYNQPDLELRTLRPLPCFSGYSAGLVHRMVRRCPSFSS